MRNALVAALLSTTALGAAGAAFAADLPSRMAPPVYTPAPPPIFTWSGFYVGVNAGYVFDSSTRFQSTFNTPPSATLSQRTSDDGFTAGGQIGYNYQFGGSGIVVGIEADAAYTDLNRTRAFAYGAGAAPLAGATVTYRSDLDYLGTVRGRVGYSFGQFLVYGTGGFAYGGVNDRVGVNFGGPFTYFGSNSDTRTGYAYGGGIEYALPTDSFLNPFHASAVTLKAEYIHYELGNSNITVANQFGGAAANSYTTRVRTDGDLVRAGLNYKFW